MEHAMRIGQLKELVAQDEQAYTFPVLDPMGDAYTYTTPNGDTADVTWSVVGAQSKARRKAEDNESRKLLRASRTQMEPEDLRERRVTLALACSVGFEGWEDDNGVALPFTRHNAREILQADDRILDQVETAIAKHSAFLSKPAPSSLQP
jgi:hypothetical protein